MSGPVRAPRIVVVFYSATGNVAALAEALAEGARTEGAETRVRPVLERADTGAIESNRRWKAWVDDNPYDTLASLDDLEWADGIALGSYGAGSDQGSVAAEALLQIFLKSTFNPLVALSELQVTICPCSSSS